MSDDDKLLYDGYIVYFEYGFHKQWIHINSDDLKRLLDDLSTEFTLYRDSENNVYLYNYYGEKYYIAKKEAREVLYIGDGYSDGDMIYDMASCPKCGKDFDDGDVIWNCNFCPDCGQALKW